MCTKSSHLSVRDEDVVSVRDEDVERVHTVQFCFLGSFSSINWPETILLTSLIFQALEI